MICKVCENVMEVKNRYIPPFPEPRETSYYCDNCEMTCSDNEATGIAWGDD